MQDTRQGVPFPPRWGWQLSGSCRGMDPSGFFHPEGERGNQRRSRADGAKQVCRDCPVLLECRNHALAVREPYGVWGGLSEEERAAWYAQRRAG